MSAQDFSYLGIGSSPDLGSPHLTRLPPSVILTGPRLDDPSLQLPCRISLDFINANCIPHQPQGGPGLLPGNDMDP